MEKAIMENLLTKLNFLEKSLAMIVDPNMAVTVLFDIIITKMEIKKESQTLSPNDYLLALDELEDWYKSRGYEYPYPTRLKEQRDHWQSKINT